MSGEGVVVGVMERFRLCKRNEQGVITEFACFGTTTGDLRVVTPEQAEEFARLVAIEESGGDAD